ncbi:hypothetical protein [Paracoccus hibiscisoli]|uniref:Uncharacterized protein n=1 Tax=Paracoccus hibiscisoli TaxID=2023261 RepID=A0A4U0QTB4_9RHOB|nr:hypothetical protein [Paracoccus hibiscisoli]TJZ84870.1 hypothetical protein FA740_07880 [Paracoccus hibiscisoli]
MTPLDLHSERFARTGNMAAEGFRRLLGRPALSMLQAVIREALQNSIDASPGLRPIEILLRRRVLLGHELEPFRRLAFAALPSRASELGTEDEGRMHLNDVLAADRLAIFEVADFGTSGLSGPSRADIASETEPLNFVNFLRNVGAPRDTQQGGGTYGYGKTSLYSLSSCSTIIVDSQTMSGGQPARRIMGCHLGNAFDEDVDGRRCRFTGRHWWGRTDCEGGVDPLEGGDAERLARALGFPERDETRTGTTIAIISPLLENESSLEPDLLETVLWNFWPRMCAATDPGRKLKVSIDVGGRLINVPPPEEFPPLDLYCQALTIAREGKGEIIRSQRPKAVLGSLGMARGMRAQRDPRIDRRSSPLSQQASHIALMRPVELVVRYLEGNAFPDSRYEWAGVFICSEDPEIEAAFAEAEPPAHDDWVPNNLPKGNRKTFVNVGLRELARHASSYVQPKEGIVGTATKAPSIAETAALLGKHLDMTLSKGPGRATSAPGSRGGRKKGITISPPRFTGLDFSEGRRIARFEADIRNDGSSPGMCLDVTAYLILDGAMTDTSDLPAGYEARVIDVELNDRKEKGSIISIGTKSGVIMCRVSMPADAAVGLRLDVVAERP